MGTIGVSIYILAILNLVYAADTIFDYSIFGTSPRKDLNFTELAKYDGYSTESHTVTTEDGYILGLFRIPLGEQCEENTDRVPIIFMHGLYLTGDDCLVPGPGTAHCYVYADACYDVWVPNVRGNRYSRRHVSLNPDRNNKFWDFAVDEMAQYDLPAVIDYILNYTGKAKTSFVGHSQGVAMLLLLCAKQAEYNDKINVGFGLSTTAWLDNSRFIVINLQQVLAPLLTVANGLGVDTEFLPHGGLAQKTAELLCGTTTLSYPFCSVALFTLLGYNRFQITNETLPVVVGHTPGGTSLNDFNRWGQIKNIGFREYDFGPVGNIANYGTVLSPVFDLSNVTMKWVFIGSENDYVGDIRDLDILLKHLPNADTTKCVLPDKTFGHLDFIYGKDIPNYLTPKVLSTLETGGFECN